MKHMSITLLSLLTAISVSAGQWKNLFDGRTLNGWEQHGGKAVYKVVGNTIVGTSAPDTPNSFLCTEKEYGDFVLEYEYFPHATLNCGVQFRSRIREKNDRVWGYQCEIDPSDRKWSAGIYEEAGRGWLFPVESAQSQAAYKPGEWNKVRIVCRGPVIRTYLNNIPVAAMIDNGNRQGIIGLQVHGVGDNKTPMSIRWRNLRIKELDSSKTAEVIAADTDTTGALPPRGADIMLAPGKGLEAWRLRPEKVPWMNKYEKGNLQWTVDKEKGVATPKPFAGSMDTKKHFGTQHIHVEFCTPPMNEGDSPETSGNSGVYIQGRYELQICNSYGLKTASNLCGGLYKQRVPDVNAAGKPGEWQTYDIYFIPAKFDGNKKTDNARLSAKLNGRWIHRNIEITGPTGSGNRETPGVMPLRLQEHQHRVKFRNVWVGDIDNPVKLTNYDPRKTQK
ncbi:MAG: DUF1080 domain-containing protein [Kiritimatiellia bacterium]